MWRWGRVHFLFCRKKTTRVCASTTAGLSRGCCIEPTMDRFQGKALRSWGSGRYDTGQLNNRNQGGKEDRSEKKRQSRVSPLAGSVCYPFLVPMEALLFFWRILFYFSFFFPCACVFFQWMLICAWHEPWPYKSMEGQVGLNIPLSLSFSSLFSSFLSVPFHIAIPLSPLSLSFPLLTSPLPPSVPRHPTLTPLPSTLHLLVPQIASPKKQQK